MSRVGKQPISLPAGVKIDVKDRTFTVQGPKGTLSRPLPSQVDLKVEGPVVSVLRSAEDKITRMQHGTTRSLLEGMVEGVTKGYAIELEIQGVGFKGTLQGGVLVLNLGFSHEIRFEVPAGITIKVTDGTALAIAGIDKQKVGDTAARIRSYYKAEPYKGKGVRYKGEKVRRKAGKSAA
ncbi:MAG: 50S ribosomal protein L6 [Kiritimatiellia bacterium]